MMMLTIVKKGFFSPQRALEGKPEFCDFHKKAEPSEFSLSATRGEPEFMEAVTREANAEFISSIRTTAFPEFSDAVMRTKTKTGFGIITR